MPQLYFGHTHRYADLPLHYGQVPPWLAQRMSRLGGAIVESIVLQYGHSAVLGKLSDPLWFQALGSVMGMDWHSSGITTSVMGALKKALNPAFNDIGIYICGGKGKYSRQTPVELTQLANRAHLKGDELVKYSRLTAKVDNNAVQDHFQVYLHTFVVTKTGEWAVIQQGMNDKTGMARRYHWHSAQVQSFVQEPHTSIFGKNQGTILNLVDAQSQAAQQAMLELVKQDPGHLMQEVRKIVMPQHHHVSAQDVNMKRLGAVLTLAHETDIKNFEELLLLKDVGPRAIQSLALVSEVIHGTPSRFTDPARFSFAHGGKDGHPFPVPTRVFDETIEVLRNSVEKAKLGHTDKQEAIKNLSIVAGRMEESFVPNEKAFETAIQKERNDSWKYGGRTVYGKAKPPSNQLNLFD